MKKLRIFTTFIVMMLFCSSMAIADGNDSKTDELIDKHQSKIENARTRDWKLYAECAEALLNVRIANEEVLNWITKSIDIEETVCNRILLGDYHVLHNETTEAKKEYIKAIGLAQKSGEKEMIPEIQWKILVAMGIENYNNFHAKTN